MAEPTIRGRWPVKFAKIDTAALGQTAVVPAVSGKRIRVVGFFLVSTSANGVKFQSASTDLTGAMALAANGGVTAESENGVFETTPGAALNINLTGATQVSGALSYVEIEP